VSVAFASVNGKTGPPPSRRSTCSSSDEPKAKRFGEASCEIRDQARPPVRHHRHELSVDAGPGPKPEWCRRRGTPYRSFRHQHTDRPARSPAPTKDRKASRLARVVLWGAHIASRGTAMGTSALDLGRLVRRPCSR
jgi:hypothetical protein